MATLNLLLAGSSMRPNDRHIAATHAVSLPVAGLGP